MRSRGSARTAAVSRFPPYGFRTAPGGRLETEPTEQTAMAALTALSGLTAVAPGRVARLVHDRRAAPAEPSCLQVSG